VLSRFNTQRSISGWVVTQAKGQMTLELHRYMQRRALKGSASDL
jgi:hypothetical protein